MKKVKIGFTGDFCPIGRVEELVQMGKWEKCFEQSLQFFNSNELNILDLECPLTISENKIQKTGPHLKASPKTVEILKYLNCTSVVTANNHFKDFGAEGMNETYTVLKSFGIGWSGSGQNIESASKISEFEINGVKFALINMTENEWTVTHGSEPGCNPIDYPRALSRIQEARLNGADFVIVILHGGHENYPLPSPRMKSQFRFMVDAGADAVIGHHTHIISGYEYYKNKPIFYSLGNFCFDWPGKRDSKWNKGMLLRLIFDKNNDIDFEYQFVIQNDEHTGIKVMDEQQIKYMQIELDRLNSIIADDQQLSEAFDDYAETLKPIMISRIQPYSNRLLISLFNRGLLPDIISISKKKMIKILAQCESHREVLLHTLNKLK